MIRRFIFFFWALQLVLLLSAGCANEAPSAGQTEPLPATHWFDLNLDQATVQVQLAITQGETSRGLMGRTDLEEDQGMLFLFPRPIRASFWMRNTPLPLDIGFFSPEGILLEVYPMFPYDETSVRSRSDQVQFALEMNQGWFSRNRIRPGASLDLEMLRRAVRARGFDPAEIGL